MTVLVHREVFSFPTKKIQPGGLGCGLSSNSAHVSHAQVPYQPLSLMCRALGGTVVDSPNAADITHQVCTPSIDLYLYQTTIVLQKQMSTETGYFERQEQENVKSCKTRQ